MGPENTAELPADGARDIEKLATPCQEGPGHFVAGEYGGETLRIYCAAVGSRDSTSRDQSPILDPWVWLQKIYSTQPVGSGSCAGYVDAVFWIVMSCMWHLKPLPDDPIFRSI